MTYCYTKNGTGEEEVKKGPQKFQGYCGIDITEINWLDWIEKYNRSSIIHYSLPKYNTVEEGCFILTENL